MGDLEKRTIEDETRDEIAVLAVFRVERCRKAPVECAINTADE